MVDYSFGTIGQDDIDVITGARSAGVVDFDVSPSVDPGDVFDLGKFAFKSFAPETFADATSFLPDLGELGSGIGAELGLEGAGSFLGGAAAAFGPAAAFLAWAKLMSAIAPPDDTSVLLGGGRSDLDGGFSHDWGRADEVTDLDSRFRGSGDWYEGGDPSKVADLPVGYGSTSMKRLEPYYHIGGAPYSTPDLAVASGRQIARGQMGLPVVHEPVPTTAAGHADVQQRKALPVWDAPMNVPDDWDARIDQAQRIGTGEGQVSADPGLDAWRAGLDPRARELFESGYTREQMHTYTGEGSPDFAATVDDIAAMPGELDRFKSRPSLAGYTWGALP